MVSLTAGPTQRLRSKELQRLIQISNGSFVPGNKDSDIHTKSTEDKNLVTSSVSKKLLAYKTKRRLRRTESKKSQVDNNSSIKPEGSQNNAGKKDSDDVIENRGRLAGSSSRQSRRSKSRMRSGRSDRSVTSRSRNQSRSKSRVRGGSSVVSNADSISLKAKSLDDFDVNIAAAKSLVLRRSVSGSQASTSGKSIHSAGGRTTSGLRARKSDDCSSIGGDSVLSNQLSMISNLEELSELDATVMSAGEGTGNERTGNERPKYSRRSVSSSRSHSRTKGGRSDFSKRHSRRRKKSSNGSISGSIYTTESFSANEILNELQSTTSKPSRSISSSIETSDALKDLLRKSREVLKEASESRRMRSRSLAGSRMSVGSRKSDTLTSQSQSISIASSSLQSTKVLLHDQLESSNEKTDIISKAEHSYLDSLAESFQKSGNFGNSKIEESPSTEFPHETKQNTRTGSDSLLKNVESKETSPPKKTNENTTKLKFDFKASSSLENIAWPGSSKDFFTENFDANDFNDSNPFSFTTYDSEESARFPKESVSTKSNEKSIDSIVQPIEHNIGNRDVNSDIDGDSSTVVDSPSTVQSLTSKSSEIHSNEDENKDSIKNPITTFESSQTPWPDISCVKMDTENDLDNSDSMLHDDNNPFKLDNSFGFDDGWNSVKDVSTDAFNPFFDVEADQNDTFFTNDGEDSRNVTVLSYSKGESMEDFFNDLNINDYNVEITPDRKAEEHSKEENENKFNNDLEKEVATQKTKPSLDTSAESLSHTEDEECNDISYNSDEIVTEQVVTDDDSEENSVEIMEKSPSLSIPFDESYGFPNIISAADNIRLNTTNFAKINKSKPNFFKQQFDDDSNLDNFDIQPDKTFNDTFGNNAANGGINNFEMNEKTNFMMGFVSDFPSTNDDTWDNTYDDTYSSLNEAPIAMKTRKEDPFIMKGDDELFNAKLEGKVLFDPFAIDTNKEGKDEFLQPTDRDDNFFSIANQDKTRNNDFFTDQDGFSESFGNVNYFKKTNKTQSYPSEMKSEGTRWNMNKNFAESFQTWDEWETVDENDSQFGQKESRNVGRNVAGSSLTKFSTDTDYSPSSIIPHDRIFIS